MFIQSETRQNMNSKKEKEWFGMKRALWLCLSFFLLLSFFSSLGVSAKEGYGWYVRREKDNRQPRLAQDLAWIEKYEAFYLDKRVTPEDENKVIYLTFDVGYENGNVAKILDVLEQEGVSGAFFVLSNVVKREAALVKRMTDAGHLVCNHTAHHKDNTKIDEETLKKELTTLEEEYLALTGKELARYYRAPEGRFTEQSLKTVADMGYKTIFWSFAYMDWDNERQPSAEAAKEKILSNTHNGAVILLHPTSAVNAEILGDVINAWKAMGYRFGTLHELTQKAR